ncbi:MAG: pilus assembly protein PilM [Candidatus Omnitrophica bacterium]|nr:pilus assembly protein PilM [Candidatus Omnitrophota bacterium]
MKALVAVEISERWLKVVVAKPSAKPPELLNCLVRPLSGLTDEQTTQTLAVAFRDLKVRPRPLIVCLPRNLVTVRNLHLPSQDPREIGQMIDLNIVRMVPYQKEEVLSSYQVLDVDEAGYSRVLLAIVHQEIVRRQVNLLRVAGLSADRILLGSYALRDWVVSRHKQVLKSQGLHLLLDVDAGFTDLVLFSRDHLYFSRTIAIEPNQLTEEAGRSRLRTETEQALEIFQNEEMNARPATVFLSGAVGSGEAIKRTLEEALRIPTVVVQSPLASLGKDRVLITQDIPSEVSLTAVMELGIEEGPKRLAFLLPELQIRQALKERTRDFVLLGSLGVYLLTIVGGILTIRPYHQQAYLQTLQARNQMLRQELGDLTATAHRVELIKDYLNVRELPLRYLTELQRIVPDEITVDFLSVDEQHKGIIRGKAVQLSDVFRFVTSLENSKYVDHVEPKSTRKKRLREQDVTEFELALQVHL